MWRQLVNVSLFPVQIASLEEASCSYTVRGARYARKAANSAARKGLARRGQRLVSPLRPSHAVRAVPKQGLRRPRKAQLLPTMESGQTLALREGGSVSETVEAEGNRGLDEVSGALRPDSEAETEGAVVRSASESALLDESASSERISAESDTSTPANGVERASVTVEEFAVVAEARGREGASHAVDEEPELLAERAAGGERHSGALPDRSFVAEEREFVRQHGWDERREAGALGDGLFRDAVEERLSPGLRSDVRSTSRADGADGASLVIEKARGSRRYEAEGFPAETRAESTSSRVNTGGRPSSLPDVSKFEAGGAAGAEAAAREAADVNARGSTRGSIAARFGSAVNEGSSLEEAERRRTLEEKVRGPGWDEAAGDSRRASKVKDADTSDVGPRITIWQASDDLPKGSEGPLYVVEAKRFRRGYREVWSEGRKMLEVEKRRLESQLGKRMSGSKALHRFLREEFGATTHMSPNC